MHDWHQRCLRAYDEHFQETGELPTDTERQAWVDEWAELESEDHEDVVEAYQDE
jgi:hypothetical protein